MKNLNSDELKSWTKFVILFIIMVILPSFIKKLAETTCYIE